MSRWTSAALCEINLVEARRGRGGSSGSSDEEEYVREGAADLGEAMGSSGMQCEVVALRRIWWGRVDIMMSVVGRIARRSMYECVCGKRVR
jgi:hypothetical protein